MKPGEQLSPLEGLEPRKAAPEQPGAEAEAEVAALRAELVARTSEHQTEIRALYTLMEKGDEQLARMRQEIEALRAKCAGLTAQNATLGRELAEASEFGNPITTSVENDNQGESESFFPIVVPNKPDDGSGVVLRGNLASFGLPALLSFLGNSRLSGILTIADSGVMSKLQLQTGILRLALWNRRDGESRVAHFLTRSGIVPREAISSYVDGPCYDLGLLRKLVGAGVVPEQSVPAVLKELAQEILGQLFLKEKGMFLFQAGTVEAESFLQFRVPVLDLLLCSAAGLDERRRATMPQG